MACLFQARPNVSKTVPSNVLFLRLGTDGAIPMNKGLACESPVSGLILEQTLLPHTAAIRGVNTVLDSDEASTALTAASAIPQLTAQGVQVDLCVQQGLAQVGLAVHLDERAAVLLHYLHGVGLWWLRCAEGRGRRAGAENCYRSP